MSVQYDGGGTNPTQYINVPVYFYCPWGGTITRITMLADASGSAVIDIWRLALGSGYPPVVGNSITTGGTPPTLSSQSNSQGSLSGWTSVTIVAGDVLAFNLNSVSGGATRVLLEVEIT